MPQVFRVRTQITGSVGGPMLNTLFFDQSGATAQDSATAAQLFWHNARLRISNSFSMLVEPLVYIIDVASGLAIGNHVVSTTVETGGVSGDNMPGFTQGLVTWHTGIFIAGRELMGKTFLPGVTETDNSNSAPTGGYVTDMASAAATLVASTPATPVVYSREHHTFEPFQNGVVDTQWAILRSRRA
jgi:hypothetical protein